MSIITKSSCYAHVYFGACMVLVEGLKSQIMVYYVTVQ